MSWYFIYTLEMYKWVKNTQIKLPLKYSFQKESSRGSIYEDLLLSFFCSLFYFVLLNNIWRIVDNFLFDKITAEFS